MVEELNRKNEHQFFGDISGERSIESINQFLNKEKYTVDSPTEATKGRYINPAIDGYAIKTSWISNQGWSNMSGTDVLQKYPEYTPTPEIIDYLISLDSVMEVGAGNGYWTYIINQNGGSCVGIDPYPKDIPQDIYPDDIYELEAHEFNTILTDTKRPYNCSRDVFPCVTAFTDEYISVAWSNLKVAKHTYVSKSESDYVLSCHPPVADWVEEMLTLLEKQNKKLIYVGSWGCGANATLRTFYRLDRFWDLKEKFSIYDWETTDISGLVFEPKTENSEITVSEIRNREA